MNMMLIRLQRAYLCCFKRELMKTISIAVSTCLISRPNHFIGRMSTLKSLVRHILTLVVLLLYLPAESWSLCTYRGIQNLPPEVFVYWGNWGCYVYNRPDLFNGYPIMASSCKIKVSETIYDVPGIKFNETCVPFDFTDPRIKEAVEDTFKYPSTVQKWIDCSLDAERCCVQVMKNSVPEENHCPPVWDGWSCFDSIPGGQTSQQVCSKHAYGSQPPRCNHFSYKQCFDNGSWKEKTNYDNCDVTPNLKFRTNWHISTLALSIIFCAPAALALIILTSQKLNIIRNLVFSIIIRNLFVIMVKSIIIMDELTNIENTVMSHNKWPCKFLTFFEKLAGNAVFACMLLEGIYLHQLLTNAFRSRQSGGVRMIPFYICTSIIAVASALTWAIVMATDNDQNCWQVTEGTNYTWILAAPRLLMLLINLGLLVHIVWTLWNAFRSKDGEEHPTMRTVKSALICFPLFGIPFLFVIIHPDTDSCGLEQFYYIVNYSIEALQGIFIVIFHCYRERDIKKVFVNCHTIIKDYWNKRKGSHDSLADSLPSERRVTMRSNLEITENRTPRPTNASPEQRNEILNDTRYLSVEQHIVRSGETISRGNNPSSLMAIPENKIMETHGNTSVDRRVDDRHININSEIHLDPKTLFKNRSDDIVLLDPDERK